ncbi:MAG: hypothetical protein RB191_10990 [Terriglobia bacterium]|nr:hypothetical protein [Terriglobia bacterium]
MTRVLSVALTDDASMAITRYTAQVVAMETYGTATQESLEHARSYAVEAITAILQANRHHFDYVEKLQAIQQARRRP